MNGFLERGVMEAGRCVVPKLNLPPSHNFRASGVGGQEQHDARTKIAADIYSAFWRSEADPAMLPTALLPRTNFSSGSAGAEGHISADAQ